jgi:acetylornithine deacetylase/succinyl-diaminopimelate desuccinylase-like protein
MKAGVAASAGAIRALANAGLLDECLIELVITPDEEVGSRRGIRALLAAGQISGKMAICGEPTGLAVYLGNRGIGRYLITVHGRGGHSGQTHALDNPVPPALALCQAIDALELSTRDSRFDPPTPSITVTVIDAGASDRMLNIVPDKVVIGVDRRLLPDEDIDIESQRVCDLVSTMINPPFRADFEVLERWPACATPENALISRAAVEAVRAVGRPDGFGMDLAGNDSSFLVEAGIPALLLGPGAPEQAHVTDEALVLAELRDCVSIYARLALACVRL